MAPFHSLLEACMQTVVKFQLLQVSTVVRWWEAEAVGGNKLCCAESAGGDHLCPGKKNKGEGARHRGGCSYLSSVFFFFLQDPLPSRVLSPPISPLVHKDPECTQSRAQKKAFAISLRSSTFLIHTQTLTVQQSIFSEGWPPWRTNEQCEGWSGRVGSEWEGGERVGGGTRRNERARNCIRPSPVQSCRTSNASR